MGGGGGHIKQAKVLLYNHLGWSRGGWGGGGGARTHEVGIMAMP